MAGKTQREREAEQRKAKLDRIQEQVDEGSLTIRKMTDEERERFSPPERATDDDRKPSQRRSRRIRGRPLPPVPRP